MHTVRIVVGSSRPGRASIVIGNWIAAIAREMATRAGDIDLVVTDLKELDLPFFDEEVPPIFGRYAHEHTKAWAATVAATDAFVFIAPEYNHSYSAILKNAIDFLNREWYHKPAAFVSYGGNAGGTRATEHLRAITGELRMYDLGDMVLIPYYWDYLNEGVFAPPERIEESARAMLDQLFHWTRVMAEGRRKLNER